MDTLREELIAAAPNAQAFGSLVSELLASLGERIASNRTETQEHVAAAGAALALQGGSPEILPRRSVRRRAEREVWDEEPTPRARRTAEPKGDWGAGADPEPAAPWAGPSRGAAEPAPTVSVPFRVIRKGQQGASNEPARATATTTAAGSTADPDDWGSSGAEEW